MKREATAVNFTLCAATVILEMIAGKTEKQSKIQHSLNLNPCLELSGMSY